MNKKIIILGTAHLRTTPGKRSIDKRLYEYAYSREIITLLESELKRRGHTVYVDYRATEPNAQMKSATAKARSMERPPVCMCPYMSTPPSLTANGMTHPDSPYSCR